LIDNPDIKILFRTTTPLSGMPYRTALVCDKALEKSGGSGWFHHIATEGYGEGAASFPVNYGNPPCDPDLLIVPSYGCPEAREYDAPVVTHYSTEHSMWSDKNPQSGSGTVVAQYQARFAPKLEVMPNCVPIDNEMFKPGEKPTDRVVILYTPSNRVESGWKTKGFRETCKILSGIVADSRAGKLPAVEVIMLENQKYEDVLAVRRIAHISIDECVTGSYHSVSVESMSAGCATFANIDGLTNDALVRLVGQEATDEMPLNRSTMTSLSSRLRTLIQSPMLLDCICSDSRKWMEKWYSETFQAETWLNWHNNFLKTSGRG